MKKPKDIFRKTGMITYKNRPIELWLSKNKEILFKENGKAITDPEEIAHIFAYLKEANEG
ncbi:hypothetical protein [Dubosiella newyorkensis]|jgi:hypothetical protein|uniref:Uncharacterized protein n=1 Tax=Dubosiella newyorkensis TaxID=1862672 RepID=A0A1U7NPX5_9FIRM|nr:hypothetical protein [Dubosiella newyorkensis]MCI9040776.1 hypothetical protein [Dubosiella newyorkensis]OLU47681.1 hypothetical protein BO225_02235 [Dubosiella newyorkensis]